MRFWRKNKSDKAPKAAKAKAEAKLVSEAKDIYSQYLSDSTMTENDLHESMRNLYGRMDYNTYLKENEIGNAINRGKNAAKDEHENNPVNKVRNMIKPGRSGHK